MAMFSSRINIHTVPDGEGGIIEARTMRLQPLGGPVGGRGSAPKPTSPASAAAFKPSSSSSAAAAVARVGDVLRQQRPQPHLRRDAAIGAILDVNLRIVQPLNDRRAATGQAVASVPPAAATGVINDNAHPVASSNGARKDSGAATAAAPSRSLKRRVPGDETAEGEVLDISVGYGAHQGDAKRAKVDGGGGTADCSTIEAVGSTVHYRFLYADGRKMAGQSEPAFSCCLCPMRCSSFKVMGGEG